MSSNKPNAVEMADIANIADVLNQLLDLLIAEGRSVQIGNVPLYDVNGEAIGTLVSDDELSQRGNWFMYKAEEDDDE